MSPTHVCKLVRLQDLFFTLLFYKRSEVLLVRQIYSPQSLTVGNITASIELSTSPTHGYVCKLVRPRDQLFMLLFKCEVLLVRQI